MLLFQFFVVVCLFLSVLIMSFCFFFLQHLADTSHGVRNKCLQLLGNLGSLEKTATKDSDSTAVRDVQKIIGDYFSDQDPRVRTAAIKAMVNMIMETKWGEFCFFVFLLSSWLMLPQIHFESPQDMPYAYFQEGMGGINRTQKHTFLYNSVLFFGLLWQFSLIFLKHGRYNLYLLKYQVTSLPLSIVL